MKDEAEKKSLELYPIKDVGADYPVDANEVLRKAFLKGVEYAKQSKQEEDNGLRKAAEKAFSQARKQTSILGEKDVQMTDYLISPKYKTFEDYWNSKKQ